MSLRLVISPYTFGGITTKITFTTSHVPPGKATITMETMAEIPDVTLPEEKAMEYIEPIINKIIDDDCSMYFLRPVDPEIDSAPTYNDIIKNPIDLQTIRNKSLRKIYTQFSQLIDDIKLLISNATTFNQKSHPVHQAALKMSVLLRDIILQLNSTPEELLKNKEQMAKKAENRIADAARKLQSMKKDRERARKASETKKAAPESSVRMSPNDYQNLAKDIKSLSSSQLIGVVEILKKSEFSVDMLPLNVDLRDQSNDPETIKKLKKYVESIKDDKEPSLYAWHPFEPKDLASLREQYAVELQSWKDPPPDKQNNSSDT